MATRDDKKKTELQDKIKKLQEEEAKKNLGAHQEELGEVSELEIFQKEKMEAEEKLLRCIAEMQNMKRRSEEDKRQFVAFANQSLILEVLTIVDAFNRSVAHLPAGIKDHDWVKGVLLIDQQFNGFLTRQGVKEIECKVGDRVDPGRHEVMMKGEGDEGKVVEVLEKGYEMNGRVLKAAKVTVGNGN